jgi:dihydroorotase
VGAGLIGLQRFVTLMSVGPAAALALPGGTLEAGAPGDVTILDLGRKWKVDPERFASKGRHTPFAGWTLTGAPAATIVGGRVVWQASPAARAKRR